MARNPLKRKILKRVLWTLLAIFILMNIMAYFHAYTFTHFVETDQIKTKHPKGLSSSQKIKTLFFGINNPRPENKTKPGVPYETIELHSNKKIECWYIPAKNSKGTIALFHGYSGEKSTMLDKSEIFRDLGFNTLLVDFMGSGNSKGNQTTIGFLESQQVKTSFDYLKEKGDSNIYLFGTSMGAVGIMKSLSESDINPKGIILECPFGTMYQTVCARFESIGAPSFPMAGLLVFWGGVQNGFWAFDHNPQEYAKKIKAPSLLLWGAEDKRVSNDEIHEIFNNLDGAKTLKTYPNTGHENYLLQNEKEWTRDVLIFLKEQALNRK